MKNKLKGKAIKLRRIGLSYSEIRKQVKVSKSSLSLWLRSVGLTKRQKQRLTEKKWASIRRGWEKWRQMRVERTQVARRQAIQDIKKIKFNTLNLWIMGIMLYWAEGAKSKEYRISERVSFSNSDPYMIKLFVLWLRKALKISIQRIKFDIYIHETHKRRKDEVRQYWSKITGFSKDKFDKIYFKKHKINSLRKNIGINYHGLLRVQVRKSTDLNRKISGWIDGICQKWEVV